MLSGVLIKSLGIYALARIFYNVIGITPTLSSILMFLGVLSMVIGGLLALGQWDLKRLLAYSSISQVGYVILGIGLAGAGAPLGAAAGLFHLFNHSIFKSLLFLNSGAVEYSTGTRDLQKMGGLARKMPFTTTTSFIGSMSIAGVPPFNGFWSKLFIIIAAVQVGRFGYAFLAALVSILTLAMYLKVLKYGFFGTAKTSIAKIKEVPFSMKLSMGILAFICLIGGMLIASNINSTFLNKAGEVLTEGVKYSFVISRSVQ